MRPLLPLLLQACILGSVSRGGEIIDDTPYAVGGNVEGLRGKVVLQLNAAQDLALMENGAFEFGGRLRSGNAIAVTVALQPQSPAQDCVVV